MQRADDDAGESGNHCDIEQNFAGFLESCDDLFKRRAGFLLQCADDKDTDDRDHAGLAGFPIFNHQCVDENRKRNQKHPAQPDDAAKLGNLISR